MNEKKQENLEDLKQYYKIKEKIGSNWRASSSKLYFINKQWFNAWKKYVNKEYFILNNEKFQISNKDKKKENEEEEVNEKKKIKWEESPSPGPISNDQILIDLKSFYNDGDSNNPENYIIKQELNFKTDIKIVHENVWNYFFQKFKGGPILCYIIKRQNNKEKENINQKDYLFELNKTEIKLLFLPQKSEIIGNDEKIKKYFSEDNIKSIYISKDKLIEDLRDQIVNIENKNMKNNKSNHYGEEIKSNEIKLWQISLNEFNIKKLDLLMIDYYGKEVLDEELKENYNIPKKAKDKILSKKVDKLILHPKNLDYFYDNNKANIEEIFPDNAKTKSLVFIERFDLNYFQENTFKKGKCQFCQIEGILLYSCSCQKVWYCTKKCQYKDFNDHFQNCKNHCLEDFPNKKNIFSVQAICGLRNLGNTCYMNTALQCLNSCWELTNFFLKKNYINKKNKDNPLGYKGVLCDAYSNLIHHLWYGVGNSYNPTIFHLIIGNMNETFRGKNQQDAQEFLNFLIDGLHEDLNLVVDKPIIKEEKIKNEKIKSKIEWLNFKRRNQSVLIKLFYGQFLSNISCPNPECQYSTTKFEPFMSISVPLTLQSRRINITCYFIFYYTNIKPIKIELTFNNNCTVMALRNKISQILKVHPFSFVVCKINEEGVLKYFANYTQQLSIISKSTKVNNSFFFLMQLDPEIFNDQKNNTFKDLKRYQIKDFGNLNYNILKRTESLQHLFNNDYPENENGAPKIENNPISYYQISLDEESINSKNTNSKSDKNNPNFGNVIVENYGLKDNFILIPLYINWYNEQFFKKPKYVHFLRILIVKKDITCKDLHKLIFKIFSHTLKEILGEKVEFKKIFKDLPLDMEKDYNKKDTYKFHVERNYPYRIRIVNVNKKKISLNQSIKESANNNIIKPCLICNETNCRNCLLPYSSKIKLSYYLEQVYPKNSRGQTVDGTYYFLNNNQKKLINYQNQDFQLEMTWLENYKIKLYDRINDFENLKFESTEKEKIKKISLTKCFEYFTKWEKLENYSYKCEVCKEDKAPPLKKIQIYKCPYYLIIHLKRFIDEKNKINTEVIFPLRGFDLNNYVINPDDPIEKIYDIRCIMYHSGDLGYGHYYSICYNTIHNKWFMYNDDRVTEIKESEISTKDAYVLFYRRRGLENMVDLERIYLKGFKDYSNKIQTIQKTYSLKKDTLK